jgi:predicted RecB family nuclease
MVINSQLFEAYLKCATKCYLKATGEAGAGNAYAEWLKTQNEAYRIEGVKHLTTEATQDDCINSPIKLQNLRTAKWRLAINLVAGAQNLDSTFHAVERVSSEGKGKPAQFIPIRFVFTNKTTKNDRLLMAFDSSVLSKSLGRKVNLGKIIHGDNHNELKVKVSSLASGVEKAIEKILKLTSTKLPPDFTLNKHCSECEFQEQCRKKAIEKDELSLLAGMSEKEKKKLNNKGIFTITQLSYTFRPRRRPRRFKNKPEKYHHSLKALAVREKKIHIVGSPALKIEGTPVYLDVEGLPDKDFYFLIGMRIVGSESTMHHSLWADNEADEKNIWNEFLCLLATVENPELICYGNYEKGFLKAMCERYGDLDESSSLSAIIKNTLNLLLTIYARIYFPVYSNGLKDIAGLLGFKWSEPNASGIQSIIWRKGWEHSHDPSFKEKLTIYNAEDCEALARVTDCLRVLASKKDLSDSKSIDVVNTDTLPRYNPFKFQKNVFVISELEEINRAAYWDYQRDKILVKSNNRLKKIVTATFEKTRAKHRVNTLIRWPPPSKCQLCGEQKLYKHQTYAKIVSDIKFSQFGIKKWITKYLFYRYRCAACNAVFQNSDRAWTSDKFGPNIQALSVYLNIDIRLSLNGVAVFLNQILGYNLSRGAVQRFKGNVAANYSHIYEKLIQKIISGHVVHADETTVNSDKGVGYVWVFTSLEDVVYIYAPTREGDLLNNLLKDFKGVLVSDFYAAYDSLNCPQQKCLIHLIRDLNETLYKEPFNVEFKSLVTDFTCLIKPMIETINRFGLKARFLRKHKINVESFFKRLSQNTYSTEIAIKCRNRLEKNRSKLFVFLDYDGVPWNNNNAEHAIKPFALLRRGFSGVTTEKGLRDYLILLSICETCKYKGLSFFEFLRSGETNLDAFAQRKVKRKISSPTKNVLKPLGIG